LLALRDRLLWDGLLRHAPRLLDLRLALRLRLRGLALRLCTCRGLRLLHLSGPVPRGGLGLLRLRGSFTRGSLGSLRGSFTGGGLGRLRSAGLRGFLALPQRLLLLGRLFSRGSLLLVLLVLHALARCGGFLGCVVAGGGLRLGRGPLPRDGSLGGCRRDLVCPLARHLLALAQGLGLLLLFRRFPGGRVPFRFVGGLAFCVGGRVAFRLRSGVAFWFHGGVALRFCGRVASWFHGGVAFRFCGRVAFWFYGGLALPFAALDARRRAGFGLGGIEGLDQPGADFP
jgi:hypothetical protein